MDLFKMFRPEKSKNVAKERLKMVLIHDRTNISPQFMDKIRAEMLGVVSQYVEVDESEFNLQFTRTRRESDNMPVQALVANIPIKKMK
ncbi:MAG: cell division topological specificity factor MinE [Tissierellales bacterium]|jgi:cell division topological specificity factor|nr:cell division topological specificity factor MinE [Tissierellales bacterium]